MNAHAALLAANLPIARIAGSRAGAGDVVILADLGDVSGRFLMHRFAHAPCDDSVLCFLAPLAVASQALAELGVSAAEIEAVYAGTGARLVVATAGRADPVLLAPYGAEAA